MHAPHPTDRRPLPRRRWLPGVALGTLLLLVVATLAGVASALQGGGTPSVVRRADPASDLVGWLPADAETRRGFAVWTGEPDRPADDPGPEMAERLGLSPSPLTLGRGADWRDRFGYAAPDVTGWATGGSANGGLAVLAGRFDVEAIETALTAAGYRHTDHHGARLFTLPDAPGPAPTVDGDATSAANTVALLDGRVITAGDAARAKAAVDAALGRGPSLADEPAITALLRTLGPAAGLMVTDAADHAAACGFDATAWRQGGAAASGRHVAVAYGQLGAIGERRTLVAVAYPDETTAAAASGAYQGAWLTGRIVAGAAVADLSAFGRLGNVSQTGRLQVAELLTGRTDGWAPTGVRFAEAVCTAVADALPTGPTGAPNPRAAAFDLALSSLPDAGNEGAFVAADLAAIAAARNLPVPTGDDPAQIRAWLDGLGALPSFSVLPLDDDRLARWPSTLGIALTEIDAVAEARSVGGDATVGVLVGRWHADRIAGALKGHGYQDIYLGDALHLSLAQTYLDRDDHPTRLAGGTAWDNVAILGDRVLVSASSQALRAAMAALTDAGGRVTGTEAREALLAIEPQAVAVAVVGSQAARQGCIDAGGGALAPSWRALAAIRSIRADGEAVLVAALPGAEETVATVASDLDEQIRLGRMTVVNDEDAGPLLTIALGDAALERFVPPDHPGLALVVARFALAPSTPIDRGFFAATAEGCQFVTRR